METRLSQPVNISVHFICCILFEIMTALLHIGFFPRGDFAFLFIMYGKLKGHGGEIASMAASNLTIILQVQAPDLRASSRLGQSQGKS